MTDTDEAVIEMDEGDDDCNQRRIVTRSRTKINKNNRTNDPEGQNAMMSYVESRPSARSEFISDEMIEEMAFNFDDEIFGEKEVESRDFDKNDVLIDMDESEVDRRRRIIKESKTLGSQRAPVRDAVDRSRDEQSCGPDNRSTRVKRPVLANEENTYRKSVFHGISSFQDGNGREADDFTVRCFSGWKHR
jgi:hypothetical protein